MTIRGSTRSTATIAQRVAEYIVGLRYEDIPAAVVDKAKELLAHHIATAVRGRTIPKAASAAGIAFELSPVGGPCTIVGERRGTGLLDAAFANGSLMAGITATDALFPAWVNPGLATFPAAWAVGEAAGTPGRELLTALIAGYDVTGRLHGPGWGWEVAVPRPIKFVAEVLGAAAVTARLHGLNHEQTVHALGHAGQMGTGVYEGTEQQWLLHPIAVRNGMLAAMLARSGLPAASTIVEGRHGIYRSVYLGDVPDSLYEALDTLGQEFRLSQALINRGNVSMLNFLPMELTRQLVTGHGLTADGIAALDLVLPEQREPREKVLDSYAHDGPRYLMAIIATGGSVEAARFDLPPSPEVVAMAKKVRLRFEQDHPITYARVELTTTGGERHIVEDETHSGARVDRASTAPVDWTKDLAQHRGEMLSEDRLSRLIELIRNLEDLPDFGEVMACLRTDEATRANRRN